MRVTTWMPVIAAVIGFVVVPLRAENLTRWVQIAQVPEVNRTTETIPTPHQLPDDCPTLEQLGYQTKRLTELSLNIDVTDAQLPADCSEGMFRTMALGNDGRDWFDAEFNWAASDLFAQPAYFDDPVLERYGQTRSALVQPWLSGVHFFGQFPLMPYKMAVDRPFERVYTLGYQRPGSPMPCVARRLPRP
jgi:hypothetical protein